MIDSEDYPKAPVESYFQLADALDAADAKFSADTRQGGQRTSHQALFQLATTEVPEWNTITLQIPDANKRLVTVTVDRGSGRQPAKRTDLIFDRATAKVVERGGYAAFSRAQKVRRWLRFAHTGEVYGIASAGVFFAAGNLSILSFALFLAAPLPLFIAGLGWGTMAAVAGGAIVLGWTGLAMAWRRLVRPRARSA